jgi:Fe2+ transport system protein FeoA
MSRFELARRLSSLSAGQRGAVVGVLRDVPARADRLGALGVTPGAAIHVLQTFPGFVFMCDYTEVAVEPAVAGSILIDLAG